MIKFLILAICYLFLYPSECNAGKISYRLNRLDEKANDTETPFSRTFNFMGINFTGTRLLIKYEVENQNNGIYDSLWSAEIKYIPKSVSIKGSPPNINTEPSVVDINYFLRSEDKYKEYYNLPGNYPFPRNHPSHKKFQYQVFTETSSFTRVADRTELFRWEKMDDNRDFSIENVINIVGSLRNGEEFPPYCAKGFTLLRREDVLNCITFDMRLLNKFFDHGFLDFSVSTNHFINQHINNKASEIALPDRFLKPLVEVCYEHGGWINHENISEYYNNEYYTNENLRKLLIKKDEAPNEILRLEEPHGRIITSHRRYGSMWITGDAYPDIRPIVNRATALSFIGCCSCIILYTLTQGQNCKSKENCTGIYGFRKCETQITCEPSIMSSFFNSILHYQPST